MLGYERSEYIGRNITEIHADPQVIRDILNCLHRGERLKDYPAVLKCGDGSMRNVLIDSCVLWQNGAFLHTQCFTRDVTFQKAAGERLRLYKEIFASSRDAIAIIRPDGVYIEQNDAHRVLIGYSDDELRDKTPSVHLGEAVFAKIGAALAEKGAVARRSDQPDKNRQRTGY